MDVVFVIIDIFIESGFVYFGCYFVVIVIFCFGISSRCIVYVGLCFRWII